MRHVDEALAQLRLDAAARARGERVHSSIEDDFDSFGLEGGLQLARRLSVGACRDLWAGVHDRHTRSEAREDLRELEPDGSRADDEQRLRHVVELERGDMVEPRDAVDPGNRWDGRAAAGGDEDLVAAQLALADEHRLRIDEARR